MGLQRVTISYRRFQSSLGVTSGYMGLQLAKAGFGGLQGVLRGYKRLQWFTRS